MKRLYIAVILSILAFGKISCQTTNVNSLMCVDPIYPCYYYYCDKNGNKLALRRVDSLRTFRCAKGLVFSEKLQRCVYTLPWKSCEAMIDDKYLLSQAKRILTPRTTKLSTTSATSTTTKKELQAGPRGIVTIKSNLKANDSKNVFNILTSSQLRIEYLNSIYGNLNSNEKSDMLKLVENEQQKTETQQKIKFNIPNSKINIEFSHDLNVTVDSEDLQNPIETIDEKNRSALGKNQYAYIIVPVKLSNVKKIQNMQNNRNRIKFANEKKKKIPAKNLTKSYEGFYFT